MELNKRLGYLSGAPRVSTRPEAVLSGPRSHVLGVIRAFAKLGWVVKPFIVGDLIPLRWAIGQASETALRSSYLKRFIADLLRLQMGIVNGWQARRKIGKMDWVYERFGLFQALGWWFQREGIPWILETNAPLSVEAARDRTAVVLISLAKTAEVWAYHQCDALVCVSQTLADLVIREMGVDAHKVVVVPNAVNTEYFDPLGHSPKRLFGTCTLGFVGNLSPWQRLDLLIEALAQLRQGGIDIGLVVVGDGPMRQEWETLAYALGQRDRVHFVGQVSWSEVPAYIAGFDIGYVGPVPLSVGEMYLSPLKLYEYAAMGRPVLASASEDAYRLIFDGVTGYLFAPGDKEELKESLRRAYAQRQQWTEMGARARRLVVEQHSWVVRIQEMISKVEPILEAKYGSPYPTRRGG